MGTFVLVHGGGQGGWCWKECARALRAAGHEVHAPTLTGFGERAHTRATGFETYVEDVARVLDFEDLREVVLVGHSMGGCIVARVAERARERIASVVFVAAVVARDGETLLQATPQTPEVAAAVRIGPDGTAHTDPVKMLEANLHDGDAAQREWVRHRHTDYPPYGLVEPGRLSAFLALGLPTGYVVATQDRTIDPKLQEEFSARLPGCRRARVDAGHGLMITRPEETARAILAVAGA
jgi:pimeloyl-ACP methyl ester carboxylesterase